MSGPIHIAILAAMPRHALRGNTQGRGGGHAATWLPPLADALLTAGELRISWLTFDHTVSKVEIDRDSNQEFWRIPQTKIKINFFLRQWPARLQLRKILNQIKPDIVHVWGTECLYAIALQDVKVPKILSIQGCLTAFNKVWKPSYVHSVLGREEPVRVREADILTCESLWSAEQIREIHPSGDIRVVDYGVHPSFFDVKWDPDPHNPILLYSGSLDCRKGFDLLIDALAALPHRNWKCQIIGDGPLRSSLVARNLPGVEWLGILRWKEMQEKLAKAWALVVPTRADTGPTVVKEARVIGMPVIGTRHGGLRDYIRHGESGIIVDPLNSDHLTKACSRMMEDYSHVREMGGKYWQEDREAFSSELTAHKFIYIYQEIARQHGFWK